MLKETIVCSESILFLGMGVQGRFLQTWRSNWDRKSEKELMTRWQDTEKSPQQKTQNESRQRCPGTSTFKETRESQSVTPGTVSRRWGWAGTELPKEEWCSRHVAICKGTNLAGQKGGWLSTTWVVEPVQLADHQPSIKGLVGQSMSSGFDA